MIELQPFNHMVFSLNLVSQLNKLDKKYFVATIFQICNVNFFFMCQLLVFQVDGAGKQGVEKRFAN